MFFWFFVSSPFLFFILLPLNCLSGLLSIFPVYFPSFLATNFPFLSLFVNLFGFLISISYYPSSIFSLCPLIGLLLFSFVRTFSFIYFLLSILIFYFPLSLHFMRCSSVSFYSIYF
jgi:hypothetical protein